MKKHHWLALGAAGAAFWYWQRIRIKRWKNFEGRTVLITGGSRGLGFVLAHEFLCAGAQVALLARDRDELEEAKRRLESGHESSPKIEILVCDLRERDAVRSAVEHLVKQWGRLDVLVNNAGIVQVGPQETMTWDDYQKAIDIHLWGPLAAIQSCVPYMRRQGEGRIVNITSVGARVSVPHLVPYCVSKFALDGLSEGLHAELAKDGIGVTTVVPGLMRTGSPSRASFKGRYRLEYAWFALSDSSPLLSIHARRAARSIVRATRQAKTDLILSFPAQILTVLHGLFPGVVADALSVVNRWLPSPGPNLGSHRGSESLSVLTPSTLTKASDRAAAEYNQFSQTIQD